MVIKKNMKILEFQSRVMKKNENHRIPRENHENHENPIAISENYENYENH